MTKIEVIVKCPLCDSEEIVKCGKTSNNKQKYRCNNKECNMKTFLLDYKYNGCRADIKQKIIDMAINASGIRDTARVLDVDPHTVINTLKKQKRCLVESMKMS